MNRKVFMLGPVNLRNVALNRKLFKIYTYRYKRCKDSNLVGFTDMIKVPSHLNTKKKWCLYLVKSNETCIIKSHLSLFFTGMVEEGVRAKMALHCSLWSGVILYGYVDSHLVVLTLVFNLGSWCARQNPAAILDVDRPHRIQWLKCHYDPNS